VLKGGLERLNLINPDFVENLHREYIASGSRFIETNTFQANRINLEKYNAENDYKEIIAQGVLLVKKATHNNDSIYIAGSLGPVPPRDGDPLSLSE
jgi:methionine synthase I (cobalamin-dependent)